MYKVILLLVCLAFLTVTANADPVIVSYSTTGLGPLAYQADTFALTGQSGSLTLDSSATVTADINTAVFFTGDSGLFSGSEPVTLTYFLTLDGVTQAVTQTATWTITPAQDFFVTVAASAPVLFSTPDGSWDVTLDSYSFSSTFVGQTQYQSTSADFVPTPEPGSLALLGFGVLGLAAVKLSKR